MMIGQHTVENLAGAKTRIRFQLAAEETAGEYQKIVRKYAQSVQIKGFRKGKVPLPLLERRFGRELRSETFQGILEQCRKETLPHIEPQPLPYSQPYLCDEEGQQLESDLNFWPGQPLEFALAFERPPEIPLPTLAGLGFAAVRLTVGAEEVARELEHLREQNAVMIERKGEAGAAGDILSLSFALLPAGQTEPKELWHSVVRIGEPDAYNFHDQVQALKSGEVRVLNEHSFPENVEEAALRGQSGRVWVKVKSVRKRELPELDDDFAQDIDENYATLEDLQKAIRQKLEQEAEQERYSLLQIYRHWAGSLDFALPRSMVAYHTRTVVENLKKRLGDRDLMMYLAMTGDIQAGLRKLEKEALLGLFVDLLRKRLLQSKGWEVPAEEIDRELERMAPEQKQEEPQIRAYLEQLALSSRLSRELIAEAETSAESHESLGWSALQEKRKQLETVCEDLVYQKFSPFQAEGGLLKA